MTPQTLETTMPELQDLELRMRKQEEATIEARGNMERVLKDVGEINRKMDMFLLSAAEMPNYKDLRADVLSAHQRLDKLAAIEGEHKACQATKILEAQSKAQQTEELSTLKIQYNELKNKVDGITANDNAVKGFWMRRLENMLDKGGPIAVAVIIALVAPLFFPGLRQQAPPPPVPQVQQAVTPQAGAPNIRR